MPEEATASSHGVRPQTDIPTDIAVLYIDEQNLHEIPQNKNYLPQFALGYGFGDLIADDDEDTKIFVNSLYF